MSALKIDRIINQAIIKNNSIKDIYTNIMPNWPINLLINKIFLEIFLTSLFIFEVLREIILIQTVQKLEGRPLI